MGFRIATIMLRIGVKEDSFESFIFCDKHLDTGIIPTAAGRMILEHLLWEDTPVKRWRTHNLDEKRRKYLEDLRWQVNNLSTAGPLNNLLNAMGLNHVIV